MAAIRTRDIDLKGLLVIGKKRNNVEAVFSTNDPLPNVAELALVPWLAVKRGFKQVFLSEQKTTRSSEQS